jgi:hypothetical protein
MMVFVRGEVRKPIPIVQKISIIAFLNLVINIWN